MPPRSVVLVETGQPDSQLPDNCCQVVAILKQEDDLEAAISQHQPDVVVLDLHSPSPLFFQALKQVQAQQPIPVVIFSRDDTRATIEQAIEAGVMSYVVDSINNQRIKPILETAISRFNHYRRLQQELQQARTELADRKEIERAKGILMEKKQLSEADAYQLLRRTAMQQNRKLVDIARNIVSASELLFS
ncbi:MAG: ANTAR domain-containing protein [Chromatiales bacterium]|jgi:response regulator NasT